jgi:hypothetical protein
MHLDPSDESARLFFGRDIQGPVNMLNMLRFKEIADYSAFPDLAPPEPISGAEAYDRYIVHTLPFLLASGGEVTYLGTGGSYFVGPVDERWDLVLLTKQASMQAFLAFASNHDYQAGLGHRTAALSDSRLLPLVERPLPA